MDSAEDILDIISLYEPDRPSTVALGIGSLTGAGRTDLRGLAHDPTGAVPALADALAGWLAEVEA